MCRTRATGEHTIGKKLVQLAASFSTEVAFPPRTHNRIAHHIDRAAEQLRNLPPRPGEGIVQL